MQDCGYQVTHSPEGRLQLHWERATKAVHQIPRSKTPQTASERGNVDNVNIIIIRLVTERVG